MSLADGDTFAGYTILRQLGAGGMGVVYLVQHPRLPRREALKILPPSLTNDEEFRQRFHREADIAATLWHPSIVAIHDRGEFDGQLWITMDYVDGTDAAQLLKDRYPDGMPTDRALTIVSAVASALDHAHHKGLLHRDVKPANILLTEGTSGERRVVLADFGIARKQDEISGLTATNMTVGSVTYAAPEQLTGSHLDGRADQYALAFTAFHLLAGHPPFDNSNPAVVIGQHLTATPPRLSSRRADLSRYDEVLLRAMAKEPDHRFGSCEEFATALTRAGDRAADTEASFAANATMGAPAPDATMAAPAADATMPAPASYPRSMRPGPTPPDVMRPDPVPAPNRSPRPLWAAVAAVAAVLVIALVVFVAVGVGGDDTAAGPSTTSQRLTTVPRPSTVTVTQDTVTVSREATTPPPPPVAAPPPGDLGLSIPMTRPACDGTGIVVLYNAVTPGEYRNEIERALSQFPGASYLRTDQSCPSLRQADDKGNAIYAVYRVAGSTAADVCAAVASAGGGSYGKVLDMTTNPRYIIPC